MTDVVIVALITGGLSFLGNVITVFLSQKKSTALITYRIDQLEEKVNKHNNLIERMYEVEEKVSVLEEKAKVANNRIKDLEKGGR